MMQQKLKILSDAIIDGSVETVRQQVQEALNENISARDILNEGLLKGMDEVGVLFKEGEMFVPEVLVSAKAMQAGVDIIKPVLLSDGAPSSAKILTVTVEGDLHDIGIKLVGIMLEGAGFEVVNIGVDVPTSKIIEKVKEIKPQIIGLSAMLTTTMVSMKCVIEELDREGLLSVMKVMVGGAPLSPSFAEKIGGNYSADANDAVIVAKKLLSL
ncbi:MAG: corrinoid protein [Caldisericia bacterium]|nr:corrinoid protein [Caldisericia bacterium]